MTDPTTRIVHFHFAGPEDHDPEEFAGGPPHLAVRPGFTIPRIGETVMVRDYDDADGRQVWTWCKVVDVLHSAINSLCDASMPGYLPPHAHDGWVDVIVTRLPDQTHPLDRWRLPSAANVYAVDHGDYEMNMVTGIYSSVQAAVDASKAWYSSERVKSWSGPEKWVSGNGHGQRSWSLTANFEHGQETFTITEWKVDGGLT